MRRLSTNLARYRKILTLRDVKKWKFQAIGDEFGISRQRAWELHKRATERFNFDPAGPARRSTRNPGLSNTANHANT